LGGVSRLVAASLPHLRLYLIALLSARMGEEADALSLAGRIEALDVPAGVGTIPRDLARTVRADVAWRQGRPEAVVDTLAPVRGEIPLELLFRAGRERQPEYTYAFSQGHARWLRARSLHELGRSAEALRWLDTFLLVPDELLYLGPVHLAKAEAYDRLGQRELAREHYARFVGLWENADPPGRSAARGAQQRLLLLAATNPQASSPT
jgi:tetratricopeptide (TPR) repeat protein